MKLKPVLSGLLMLGASLAVSAQNNPWSAGPVAIIQASPYIGGESGALVVPAVAYEGEKLKVRGPFIDYYFYNEGREGLSIALNLALGPNELEVDNDPILIGINDRDSGFLAGVRAEHPFLNGSASLSVQTDIAGKSDGQRLVAGWSKPLFNSNPRKFILAAGVELMWESANYADYYFGTDSAESLTSGFDEYQVGSLIQPAITVGGYYNFTQNWQLIYNLELQILASEVKDSPIVDQSTVTSGVIGVVYNF